MKFNFEEDFAKSQAVPLHVDQQDLSGKTLLITGGNAGIGLQCAKELARMNPSKIILACRNMETAAKAVEAIKTEVGYINIEAWHLDQGSFASVRAFATKYNDSGFDLHLLLANAGILPTRATPKPELTTDGHEVVYHFLWIEVTNSAYWKFNSLQTNHLSAALLTFCLLPSIRRTAAKTSGTMIPRIIIVASDVHYWAELNAAKTEGNIIKAMDSDEHWTDPMDRYKDTKLLNVFFAQELAMRMSKSSTKEDNNVIVSSCNPGLVIDPLDPTISALPAHILKHARNHTEGCKTHLFASIDPSAGNPGDVNFYHNCTVTETADITLGTEGDVLRQRVWRDTLEVLNITEQDLQF